MLNKKQCRDTVGAMSPHHLVWGTKFGEHDPLWRMENMTPPENGDVNHHHPGNHPTHTGQPAVPNQTTEQDVF